MANPPTQTSPPPQSTSSRKARRNQKRLQDQDQETSSSSRSPSPFRTLERSLVIPRPLKPKSQHHEPLTMTAPTLSSPIRLLITSIGNPSPYTNTLHSAGHIVLAALAPSLLHSHEPAQFTRSPLYPKGTHLQTPTHTLFSTNALMNVSGPAISGAYKSFLRAFPTPIPTAAAPRLVVLHDDLELPLGRIKVRPGSNSPRGHNGLKSIRDSLPGVEYTRIGIGIGRPESREPDVVAAYVLRKCSERELGVLRGGQLLEAVRREVHMLALKVEKSALKEGTEG